VSRAEIAIIGVIVGILGVVALPGLWRARMARNEAAAIASLRTIVSAEIAYASVCGRNGYAASLQTLGVPPPGTAQAFLPPHLSAAAPEVDGFRFTLAPGQYAAAGAPDCNGTPTTSDYYAAAVPVKFGRTGGRAFAVNTPGTIWQAPAAAAPLEPFGAPATPVR
jgi:type II secretory pathway pseudopilin PulG